MNQQRIRHRPSKKEKLKDLWRNFCQSKYGIIGLGIISCTFFMAILAPILYPIYPGLRVGNVVGPPRCAPGWLAFFDPFAAPTGNYNPDPYFTNDNSCRMDTSNPLVANFSYDMNEFVGGHRSVKFSLFENNNAVAYSDGVWAKISFVFPYRTPADIAIQFVMKSKFTGNFTHNSVVSYLKVYLPDDTPPVSVNKYYFEFTLFKTDWEIYRRPIIDIISNHVFRPFQNVTIELGLYFNEEDASRTGTVEFWFDQLEILGVSRFYGLLGTSTDGNDILSQLFWASHISLYVALSTAIISGTIGLCVGLVAGYSGGPVDDVIMAFSNFFLIFPILPVLMVLMVLLQGASYEFVIFIIALLTWPQTARVIRSQVLVEKEKGYVESARAAGANSRYLIFRTILPNVLTIFLVQLTLLAANAVIIEASLGFFDYQHNFDEFRGTPDSPIFLPINFVSWGRMIAVAFYGNALAYGAWWMFFPPGICIGVFVI
ncbi:MAG: ABC transporter permease, partial [Candidatus Thorarchaeota archaeon]